MQTPRVLELEKTNLTLTLYFAFCTALTSIGVRLLDTWVEVRGVQKDLLKVGGVPRDESDLGLRHKKDLVVISVLHVQTGTAEYGNRRAVLFVDPTT